MTEKTIIQGGLLDRLSSVVQGISQSLTNAKNPGEIVKPPTNESETAGQLFGVAILLVFALIAINAPKKETPWSS